jgi:hypothetical protein
MSKSYYCSFLYYHIPYTVYSWRYRSVLLEPDWGEKVYYILFNYKIRDLKSEIYFKKCKFFILELLYLNLNERVFTTSEIGALLPGRELKPSRHLL